MNISHNTTMSRQTVGHALLKITFSSFPAKKLQGWLEQVGVKKLDR